MEKLHYITLINLLDNSFTYICDLFSAKHLLIPKMSIVVKIYLFKSMNYNNTLIGIMFAVSLEYNINFKIFKDISI